MQLKQKLLTALEAGAEAMKTQYLIDSIETADPYKRYGKVKRVIGLMIESKGPESSIGDVCLIYPKGHAKKAIKAEVVGFQDENILLMPYLEAASIAPGALWRPLASRSASK